MKGNNAGKSTLNSNLFQIPIEEFEKNLETEFARGKKNEILFLLTNFNHLCNEEEFKDVQQYLHEACANGDLDLIKIYLSETIYNDSKDMSFKIDKQNHTASLFKIHITPQQITIPRTVKYESTDYLITSICGLMTFCTKTIKFVEDSAVKTIYGYVFSDKGFEELHFPASLDELKEGWCCNTEFLTKIVVSPNNNNFIFKDNKFLLGKSDKNIDEFDVLLFARRDIREILIPSNIKIISSYAFDNCNNLEKVEFQENSNLQIIESYAFSYTTISKISIPSKVSRICKSAFLACEFLNNIEIPTNSNLQVIEEHAFAGSCIDKIYFPTNLNELKEGWHCNADNLTRFIISPFNNNFVFADNKFLLGKSDKNSNEFDVLHYTFGDFEKLFIPSNIKIISSYAFSKSNIKEILIPANVLRIGKSAFDCCCDLVKVEISTNSDLKIIEANAFSYTKIKEIFIPANVSKIGKSAFRNCNNLIDVDIPTNSDLKIIEANAFSYSNINKIFIPSNVTKISKFAFEFCHNLQIIEISEESKLQTFPLSDFNEYPNIIIMIPPLLKELINSIKQIHTTY